MRFTRRLVKASNLKWCADILDDGFENRPDLKSKLPHLWATLLVESALVMIVIFDDIAGRPVAGGIVSDEFASQVRMKSEPNLSLAAMERELSPLNRCILRPDEIRRLNHPGHRVNLVIFHYSEVSDYYTREEMRIIRDISLKSLLELESGYALKEVLFEFYGENDVPYCKLMGLNLRTDYSGYFAKSPAPPPPPDKHPFIVGLAFDEVESCFGSSAALLFSYSRPYIFGSGANRDEFGKMKRWLGLWDWKSCSKGGISTGRSWFCVYVGT